MDEERDESNVELLEQPEGQPQDQADGEPPAEAVQEPEDHISADQLISYLRRAHFDSTRGRRGYHQGEVNAFLLRLIEAVQEHQPLADLVRRTQLPTVRLEDGYDHEQVDDFLKAVVDLDPNPEAPKPELARGGLVAKLFG